MYSHRTSLVFTEIKNTMQEVIDKCGNNSFEYHKLHIMFGFTKLIIGDE